MSEKINAESAGCFRVKFDSDHPLLKVNAYCTRFDRLMCRGGDQTLFITGVYSMSSTDFGMIIKLWRIMSLSAASEREIHLQFYPKTRLSQPENTKTTAI